MVEEKGRKGSRILDENEDDAPEDDEEEEEEEVEEASTGRFAVIVGEMAAIVEVADIERHRNATEHNALNILVCD